MAMSGVLLSYTLLIIQFLLQWCDEDDTEIEFSFEDWEKEKNGEVVNYISLEIALDAT